MTRFKSFARLRALLTIRDRWQLGGALSVAVLAALFETVGVASILPFMGIAVDPATLDQDKLLKQAAAALGAHSWRETLIVAAVASGTLIAAGNAVAALSLWLQERVTARIRSQLATRILEAHMHRPYLFHTTSDAAALLKVAEQDVDSVVAHLVLPMIDATSRGVLVLALLGLLVLRSPPVAVLVLGTLGGAYVAMYELTRRRQAALGEQATLAAEQWQRSALEAIGGVKELIVLGRRGAAVARFAEAYGNYTRAEYQSVVITALPRYLLELLAYCSILALTVALIATDRGGAAAVIPSLALYAFAGYRLMPGLHQLFAAAASLRFGGPALRNVHAALFSPAERKDETARRVDARDVPFLDRIVLNDVSFTYPGAARPALHGVTLTIGLGEAVAFVGRSGAGKSTLADLLLGLFEPTSGAIEVDGTRLGPDTIRAWRHRIGYVPQHVFLANASIAQNIALGLEPGVIDRDAVERAARLAHVDAFAASLPEGLETVVGERGVRLSGGERQRIGIARALYGNSTVLVLDEATSALDGLTEEAVMQAIHDLSGKRTVILIAHRLRTLEACDRLVLLEEGRVAAVGSLAELAVSSTAFARFAAGA